MWSGFPPPTTHGWPHGSREEPHARSGAKICQPGAWKPSPVRGRRTRYLRPGPARRVEAPATPRLSRLGQDHDPDLGHVLDRPAEALPAEAGILDPAVGHVVDPVGRDVVDDDAPDLELAEAPPGIGEVVREDAGLEAEEAVVDLPDRVVEVDEGKDDDDRGEGLVAADLGRHRHVLEDRRREERPVGLAPRHDPPAE